MKLALKFLDKFSNFSLGMTLALSLVVPANAASVSFVPEGSQLDNDPILDLGTSVGENLGFTVTLDTSGLANPLQSLVISFQFDETEIQFGTITPLNDPFFPNITFDGFFPNPSPGLTNSIQITRVSPNAGVVSGLFNLFIDNYTVQPGLINDGLPDYRIVVVEAIDITETNVTSAFNIQEVSLHSVPESSSNLSFLALGILGAGSILKSKIRQG